MPLNRPLRAWQGQVVWLIGASSGIGRATASALHAQGAQVIVSARNPDALSSFEVAHPGSVGIAFDATDRVAFVSAASQVVSQFGRVDLALYCAGYYRAMRATAFKLDEALRHQQVNYVGALHMLDAVLPYLLKQRSGHLSVISSVAGYRGLPNSLAYGPTKAALINLAQTLYLDLHPQGIGVSVVNPGFVDTALTAQNTFSMPGLLTPEQAAQEMLRGWAQGRFEIHFPKRFTWWMKALSHVSDGLYFRAIRKSTGL